MSRIRTSLGSSLASLTLYSPCHTQGLVNTRKVFIDNSQIPRDGKMRIITFPENFTHSLTLRETININCNVQFPKTNPIT